MKPEETLVLKDTYGRIHNYLRLSVTDACNFNCRYCGPGQVHSPLDDDHILRLCAVFHNLGIETLRLTGGEPLVRRNLVDLIAAISQMGIKDLAMTTNGYLLAPSAAALKTAGLDRVNISLDATATDLFANLSGGFPVDVVLAGIEEALKVGLRVKLNCVPLQETYHDQVNQVMAFAASHRVPVRFIELMPIGAGCACHGVGTATIVALLVSQYGEAKATPGVPVGQGPAVYRRFGDVDVGLIGALTDCFCSRCNRLRLTSQGLLRACLYHPESLDLKALLDEGRTDGELEAEIRRFVAGKKLRHGFERQGMPGTILASIGG